MRITRKATLAVGVGSAAVALTAGMATPAFADPATKPPAVTDIAGVGSGTTQGVFQQLQTDYNVGKSTGRLASWDAFVPSTQSDVTSIVEKAGCTAVTRPAGSLQRGSRRRHLRSTGPLEPGRRHQHPTWSPRCCRRPARHYPDGPRGITPRGLVLREFALIRSGR